MVISNKSTECSLCGSSSYHDVLNDLPLTFNLRCSSCGQSFSVWKDNSELQHKSEPPVEDVDVMFNNARFIENYGDLSEAADIYETIINKYPDSSYASYSANYLNKIYKKLSPDKNAVTSINININYDDRVSNSFINDVIDEVYQGIEEITQCIDFVKNAIYKTKNDYIRNKAMSRVFEERLYELIANEISNNIISTGLYTKAVTESGGDKSKALSLYVKLRFQSMIDEINLS